MPSTGSTTQRSRAPAAPLSEPNSSPTTGTPGNSPASTRLVCRSSVRSVSVTQSNGDSFDDGLAPRPAVAVITSAASLASRPATSRARETSAGSAGRCGIGSADDTMVTQPTMTDAHDHSATSR